MALDPATNSDFPDAAIGKQHLSAPVPRVVVAGLAGDSGKTLVSLGLLLLAPHSGIPVRAFKKGPDYIDAAWLSWASGAPARNLDTFLMGRKETTQQFFANALSNGLNLIEGNRGLFDGGDARGTHSTAELAKLIEAPVLLVVNATKITHTAAALVLGCMNLDPDIQFAGVILNHVSGLRHESVLRESIESTCGIPVLGVLPNVKESSLLPSRHLGLVTPQEHANVEQLRAKLLSTVRDRLDVERILEAARTAPPMPRWVETRKTNNGGRGLKIGFLKDSAFTFYYPENIEALERSGAQLQAISALAASTLPEDLDALYIGGGFPETHALALSTNTSLLASIRKQAVKGLPIYAECGGLMLLSQAIRWKDKIFPMAGALPFEVEVRDRPQGHGYVELTVDCANPYYPVGTKIRGHEFHYSRIIPAHGSLVTACAVRRGTGSFKGRDAVLQQNIWASYTHVHAEATPEWALGFLRAAREWSRQKSSEQSRTYQPGTTRTSQSHAA